EVHHDAARKPHREEEAEGHAHPSVKDDQRAHHAIWSVLWLDRSPIRSFPRKREPSAKYSDGWACCPGSPLSRGRTAETQYPNLPGHAIAPTQNLKAALTSKRRGAPSRI